VLLVQFQSIPYLIQITRLVHLPYVGVSHVVHPNVQRSMYKIFWEILPTYVDRTHTYGCATIVRSRGMHQVHPNLHLHFLFKPNGHYVVNHCCNFILSEIHYLGLICVPRSKVFLIEILCSNFNICHVFVLYAKAQIVRRGNKIWPKGMHLKSIIIHFSKYQSLNDTPPSSLMHSTRSPNVKITEGKGVGACSLARSTSGVKGHVGALGWGLRRLTSKSIIHINLHKPNNKLVRA
jgi:hypothetical protein